LNHDDEINEKEEVIQINNYYAFGLNMEGNWNGANGANKYQYNGKEWNDDFGLGWNDYGARFYDPAMARWQTVDPLGEKYVAWSPYNYTMNNPIRFIDPDGRSVDNTIVTNEDGSKQFTIVDNKPDAVAIFSNEEFEKRFGFDFRTSRTQYNTNVDELRSNAKFLYMVDGMIGLEKWAKTQPLDFSREWFLNEQHQRITKGLYPEASSIFLQEGNMLTVDMSDGVKNASYKSALMSSAHPGFGDIHTHTSGFRPDLLYIGQYNSQDKSGNVSSLTELMGGNKFTPPSEPDWRNAENKAQSNSAHPTPILLYNAVVGPDYIHLYRSYNNRRQDIVIPRVSLSKSN
jgi:RHS repeat-associated protein